MNALTITLPDERLLQLEDVAASLGVTPEELVLVSVEELINRPDAAFQEAVDHVLEKNRELYRRLA